VLLIASSRVTALGDVAPASDRTGSGV